MDLDTRQVAQVGLVAYVVLVVASFVTGNPLVRLLADATFGVVVILLGVLTLQIPVDSQLKYVAGGGFVLAGLAQFAELVTGVTAIAAASTVFLLVGLVGYLLLRRQTTATPF